MIINLSPQSALCSQSLISVSTHSRKKGTRAWLESILNPAHCCSQPCSPNNATHVLHAGAGVKALDTTRMPPDTSAHCTAF